MIEDRTRRKRDEESLRNALLENRAILDNAVLGIAVVMGIVASAGSTVTARRGALVAAPEA